MTDHPGHSPHRSPNSEELRLFGILIDGVMAQTCARHYEAETQEHQLTSRIAGAIERELGNIRVGEMSIRVVAQELSDRGRGSKEKKVGADLYISITIESGDRTISKGMLVQSKWDDAVEGPAERSRLHGQSQDMLRRSKESYIWTYGPQGVSVSPADPNHVHSGDNPPVTVGGLLSEGMACNAGDPSIGLDPGPVVESLNSKLRELAVKTGLSIVARTP